LSARQPYRPPTPDERDSGVKGFSELLEGRSGLADLGFSVEDLVDDETGRACTLAVNEPGTERAWGLYLIDRSAPPSLVAEVPHPASDLRTELFGLDYFRATPGAVLLVAGAHRRAGNRTADVAHQPNSLFHVITTMLAARGLPQVQFHGFGDLSAPRRDVVLSPGAGLAGEPAKRAADALGDAGFVVCRSWVEPCKPLEGTTNVQGRAAAAAGTMFLHVEMNRSVREDDERRLAVVGALTKARLGVK
jgi:hypothetical protein